MEKKNKEIEDDLSIITVFIYIIIFIKNMNKLETNTVRLAEIGSHYTRR